MSLWIAWIYQYTCTKAQQRRLDLYLFQAILHFTKDSSSLCKWQWQPLPKDTQTHDKGSGLGCLVIYHILRHAASSIQVKSDSNSQWLLAVALYPGPLWHHAQVHWGIIHRSTVALYTGPLWHYTQVALYTGPLWHYTQVHCGIIHRWHYTQVRCGIIHRSAVALYTGPLWHYTQVRCGIIHRFTVALYPSFTVALYTGPLWHYTQVRCGIIHRSVALYTGPLWHYTQVHCGIIHRFTVALYPSFTVALYTGPQDLKVPNTKSLKEEASGAKFEFMALKRK